MDNILSQESKPAGFSLLSGSETFLKDLSEEDESIITGGRRSNSRSRRPKRRRRRNKRPARSQSRS